MIYQKKKAKPFVHVRGRFSGLYVYSEWLNKNFGLPMKIDCYIVLYAQLDLTQCRLGPGLPRCTPITDFVLLFECLGPDVQ